MVLTLVDFERLALAEPDRLWELYDGQPREKPTMSVGHSRSIYLLIRQLDRQLDPAEFEWRLNSGRVRRTAANYFIPDIFVVPATYVRALVDDDPHRLEAYDAPLPLVVEAWSPSTGRYDIDDKLPEYQKRGDLEIWRLHPFARTLRAWRRRPDGGSDELVLHGGTIQPIALPEVTIDLDLVFG